MSGGGGVRTGGGQGKSPSGGFIGALWGGAPGWQEG